MPLSNAPYPKDTKNDALTATSFLRRGSAIVPAAIGIGVGVKALLSNTPGLLSGLSTNALGEAGVTAGNAVRDVQRMRADRSNEAAQRALKNLQEGIRDGGKIRESMQRSHDELNAKIMGIIEALDDPNIGGISTEDIRVKKERLMELMAAEGQKVDEKASQIVAETIQSVFDTATEGGKRAFADYLGKYQKYKGKIVPPNFSHASGKAFEEVTDVKSLPTEAKRSYEALEKVLEGQGRVEVLRHKAGDHYARVWSGKTRVVDFPLTTNFRIHGIPVIFTGEGLTTPNAADALYSTAQQTAEAFGGIQRGQTITRGMVESRLIGAGKAYGYQEHIRRELARRLKGARGNLSAVESLNPYAAEWLEGIHKGAFTADWGLGTSPAAMHQQRKVARTHSALVITDFNLADSRTSRTIRSTLMASDPSVDLSGGAEQTYFDPSTSHARVRGQDTTYAKVGIRRFSDEAASPIEFLRTGGKTRDLFPATMRIEQAAKREEFLVPRSEVPSTMGKSGTFQTFGQNIDWVDDFMTGGQNKVAFLTGKNSQLGLGKGEAYAGSASRIRIPVINTVLDPTVVGQNAPSTPALNALQEAMAKNGGRFQLKNRGEVRRFFRKYGRLLGVGPQGPVEFKHRYGMTSMDIEIRAASGTDKHLLNIVGSVDIHDEFAKLFGLPFKGTTRVIKGKRGFVEAGERVGVDIHGIMKEMGLARSEVIIGEGSALKKGAGAITTQMTAALGLFKKFNSVKELFESVESGVRGTTSSELLLSTAEQVARQLGPLEGKFTPASIGLVFGALHSWGGAHGVKESDIERVLAPHFTREGWGRILPEIRKGVGINPFTAFAGPATSGWGTTMASMEPRMFGMMHHNLMNMGMGRDDANNLMAGIVARVEGKAETLETLKALNLMQSSINGRTSYLSQSVTREMKRVNYMDFAMASGDDKTMARFLAAQGGDFLIDFKGNKVIEGMVGKHFHSATEMFVPGGSQALLAMRAAKIRTANGDKQIAPEFVARMRDLGRLITDMQDQSRVVNLDQQIALSARLAEWTKQMGGLYGEVAQSAKGGKVRGSAYVRAQSLQFGRAGTIGPDTAQLAKMEEQFVGAGGYATFENAQGFLTHMKDSVSAAEREIIAGGVKDPAKSKSRAIEAVGAEFRRFFLGGELKGPGEGAFGVVSRHPVLSEAHAAFGHTFRFAEETGAGDDIFRRFTHSRAGRAALEEVTQAAGRKIGSFTDMAEIYAGHKNMRGSIDKFFQTMATKTHTFMNGEGGGVMYMPEFDVDVHYNGKARRIKYSPWAAAGGDVDGDAAGFISVFNKKVRGMGNRVSNVHRSSIESILAREEIEEGMRVYAGGLQSTLTPWERAAETVLKEETAKNPGSLSTALGALREGIWKTAKEGEGQLARQATALLYGMEEAPGIAGKHLTRHLGLDEAIRGAVMHMVHNDDPTHFRNIVKDILLKGSALGEKGGLQGIRLESPGANPKLLEMANEAYRGFGFEVGDDIFSLLQRAGQAVKEGGIQYMGTAEAIGRSAMRDTPEHQIAMDASRQEWALMAAMGETEGVEAIGEALGRAGNKASLFSRAMDKRFLGPAVIGIGAAMGLGLALHSPGYAPEALMEPGETVNPRVEAAIAAGNLFDQSIKGPTGDEFLTSDRMNIVDRPINPGTAYAEKRNAYQIRGQVRNPSGMREVSDFMNGIGGSASIRINDTRRPLTPNYIDRITGE